MHPYTHSGGQPAGILNVRDHHLNDDTYTTLSSSGDRQLLSGRFDRRQTIVGEVLP